MFFVIIVVSRCQNKKKLSQHKLQIVILFVEHYTSKSCKSVKFVADNILIFVIVLAVNVVISSTS